MATISEVNVAVGIREDRKNLNRTISNAYSSIDGVKMLLADICAYAFTNPDGLVDAAMLANVTAEFQVQYTKHKEIGDLYAMIEACGANDPVTGEPDVVARTAALNTLITTLGLDPATFANNRYK